MNEELQALIKPASHGQFARLLLYGAPGVGKTKLACEIGTKVLLLAVEPGDETLNDWPDIDARVTRMRYGGISHLNALYQAWLDGELDYDSLVIDTFDELVEIMLDDLIRLYKPAKNTRPTAEARPGSGVTKIEMSGNDDYRMLRDGLRPSIRDLCSLPIHIVFTSHVREPTWADEAKRKDDGTPLPPLRPDLPSQTYKLIAKYVGLIGHMTRSGNDRSVSFVTDTRKRESKSRIRELDGQVIDADKLPAIINNWSNK